MATFLQTDRLIIRDWMPEQDAPQAFKIYGDPEVMRFIRPPEESVEVVRTRLQDRISLYRSRNNGTAIWAIVEKETAEIGLS